MAPATETSPTPSSSTDPETVVRAFLEALERLDTDAAVAMAADDIVYENKGLPKVRGKAQFARAMATLGRYCDGFEARMGNLAAEGDTVLTERVDVLRRGDFAAEFWVCGTFVVRDGRIVVWRDHFDFAAVTIACLRGAVGALLARRNAR